MKILVPVKRVVDYNVKIRVKPDGSGVDLAGVKMSMKEPRYASLPNIMKAKMKPMAESTPADHGVDLTPRLKVLKTSQPATRQAGIKVTDVPDLVTKLTAAGALS